MDMDKILIPFAIAATAVGSILISIAWSNAEETFADMHQPHSGDDICKKCKNSCGEPINSIRGGGVREDTMKHTYYCAKCGRYYSVWR